MIIHNQKDLSQLSSFGLAASTRYFIELNNQRELLELSEFIDLLKLPTISLGGGSNIIFCSNYPGVVIKNTSSDIEKLDVIQVRVDAGASLDGFIKWCIDNNLYGLDALSGIPGTVGGAVALNAGAYGGTIRDMLSAVRLYDIDTRRLHIFSVDELHYWHRSSIFREKRGNQWIILDATFKLSPHFSPPSHPKTIEPAKKFRKDPEGFRESILQLRSHMPDPRLHRNAGSFFLNPTVTNHQASLLQRQFPAIVCRPYTHTHFQISAGWLLDFAGLRGQSHSGLRFHEDHANIVINELAQSGYELSRFIAHVQGVIKEIFCIDIKVEPLLVGEEFWQGALKRSTIADAARN